MNKHAMEQVLDRRDCLKLGVSVIAGAVAVSGAQAGEATEPLTDIFEVLHKRRSVRQYKPDPIPDEHIEKILAAAAMAPTAMNRQPWKFLVVRAPEKIARIKEEILNTAKEDSENDS